MRKKIRILVGIVCLLFFVSLPVRAAGNSSVSEQKILIMDWADILSDLDEEDLVPEMTKLSRYGTVVLLTVESNPNNNTVSLSKEIYESKISTEGGFLFVIDMDMREIYIECGGSIGGIIAAIDCYNITDNVYKYAKNGDFFTCALKTFEQANMMMEGRDIPKPMKHVCNIILAFAIALFVNYLFVKNSRKMKEPSRMMTVVAMDMNCTYIHHALRKLNLERKDDPNYMGSFLGDLVDADATVHPGLYHGVGRSGRRGGFGGHGAGFGGGHHGGGHKF